MIEDVVCEPEIEQTAERVIRTTQTYWDMLARRVALEQDNAPARRKRNEEEN